MNPKKLIVALGLTAAAVAAHAQINLTGAVGDFSLGGNFDGQNPLQPSYAPGNPTTSISLDGGNLGIGTLNQWWFSAIQTGGNLGTVSYMITVTNVGTSPVEFSGLITAWTYNPSTQVVGPTNYVTDFFDSTVLPVGGVATFTETEDLTAFTTPTAYFKGDFVVNLAVPEPTGIAALSIGALGLLIRRRRSK